LAFYSWIINFLFKKLSTPTHYTSTSGWCLYYLDTAWAVIRCPKLPSHRVFESATVCFSHGYGGWKVVCRRRFFFLSFISLLYLKKYLVVLFVFCLLIPVLILLIFYFWFYHFYKKKIICFQFSHLITINLSYKKVHGFFFLCLFVKVLLVFNFINQLKFMLFYLFSIWT